MLHTMGWILFQLKVGAMIYPQVAPLRKPKSFHMGQKCKHEINDSLPLILFS